jgi:tRNA-dihydrouridine synthase
VFSPTEQPIVAQIWGKNPEKFSLTAAKLAKLGFSGVDINMGCPDRSVMRNGGGAALIENPDLAVEVIEATRNGWLESSGASAISVKTRLGLRSIDEWRPWLTTLLQQNLANLTVHLRTKREMSKVPAHYELIPDIVKLRDEIAPATKLTINGDIIDRAHGLRLAKEYHGVNGLMIGRGIFVNPFAFEVTTPPLGHSREELLDLLDYHLTLFDIHHGKDGLNSKYDPLKRFFKIYVRDFSGANELRVKLMDTKSTDEARAILSLVHIHR